MTLLEEARAIARGDSMMLPTVAHLQALDEHCGLLTRTIVMTADEYKTEMTAREAWADAQETETLRRQNASTV
jgi:hypothetical protein